MLLIGRALLARPRLLLLDEPSLGPAPKIVSEVFGVLADRKRQGTTMLLVEQNAAKALRPADRAYVLELGRIALAGRAAVLLRDECVAPAYLGARSPARAAAWVSRVLRRERSTPGLRSARRCDRDSPAPALMSRR